MKRSILPALAVILAITLQIQVTLFSSDTYLGLRVNLADFLLPFIGLGILSSLMMKRSVWPQWISPFGYWALALLSVVITGGLLNGIYINNMISDWALINKGLGWLIIAAYMLAGAWMMSNAPPLTFRLFSRTLGAFFCVVLLYELSLHFMFHELHSPLVAMPLEYLQGLMFNRNSYAFLFVICAATLSEQALRSKHRLDLALLSIFWTLAPICLVLNGSRALWLAMLIVLPIIAIRHWRGAIKFMLPAVLVGAVLGGMLFQNASERLMRPIYQTQALMVDDVHEHAITHTVSEYQDSPRVRLLRDGLRLAREFPLTGAGLGTILERQKAQQVDVTSVMDNSLFWVFIEMGPVGLFSFLFVFITMLGTAFKHRAKSAVSAACFVMLLGFGVFSLFHEILYTRIFWLILGMGLVYTPIEPQAQSNLEGSPEHQN